MSELSRRNSSALITASKTIIQKSQIDDEKEKEFDFKEHLMTNEEVLSMYAVDIDKGLDSARAEQLLAEYGPNLLTPPPRTPWYVNFFHHLTGFFAMLLWLAAFLCFIAYGLDSTAVENLYLGVVLTSVVLITGIFSYSQDAKSEAIMDSFAKMLPESVNVLRDGGSVISIPAEEMVPGDVVQIKSGDKVPADIRIILHKDFKVNNSSLTGEPEALTRTHENSHTRALESTNVAFYGTLCENGAMTGVCVRTGDNTCMGSIAQLAATTDTTKTPIAMEIEHFIHIISGVAVFLGVLFLIIGFAIGTDPVTNMVFGIGIIVANVPEGLLVTVTVSLTLTAKRMSIKQVLVKNLESVETLGSTTVIASDKTGTLTQNKMTATHLFYNLRTCLARGRGESGPDLNDPTFDMLIKAITLCNSSSFDASPANMEKPVQNRKATSDASEQAFVKLSEPVLRDIFNGDTGGDSKSSSSTRLDSSTRRIGGISANDVAIEVLREHHPQVGQIPFNSANKYAVSIRTDSTDPNSRPVLYMKGAPERIWNRCTHIMINGESVPLPRNDEMIDRRTQKPKEGTQLATYQNALQSYMFCGERVLGVCISELKDDFERNDEGQIECEKEGWLDENMKQFTFVGLVSLMDPPRENVPRAVKSCQTAGIKVIMVTGDHPDTAEAIAKDVHIIRGKTIRDVALERGVTVDQVDPEDDAITAIVIPGADLEDMDDATLQAVLDYDQIVFARTSPAQKLQIVQGLQNKRFIRRNYPKDNPKPVKHVVAVTGDGVNDSPALKAADIGIAMGLTGTEVARNAADMILLNDDFSSIVDGVEEGRLIFDNLKKSIAYTLSSNIPEISPFLVFIITRIPLPLPTVLILCIDLGTDMVPAISLAYELKESDIMLRPPRDMKNDRLVTVKLISFSYLQVGIIQAMAGFYAYLVVLNDYGFPPSILMGLHDAMVNDVPTNQKILSDAQGTYLLYEGDKTYLSKCHINDAQCHEPDEALAHAQAAFFVSIIIVQWADILACKTRFLSLKQQGMRNGMLNFGLAFETLLGAILCYVTPLNQPLGTRPLAFVHWLPAMPFAIIILCYDETRKFIMRNGSKDPVSKLPNNWMYRNTYY